MRGMWSGDTACALTIVRRTMYGSFETAACAIIITRPSPSPRLAFNEVFTFFNEWPSHVSPHSSIELRGLNPATCCAVVTGAVSNDANITNLLTSCTFYLVVPKRATH